MPRKKSSADVEPGKVHDDGAESDKPSMARPALVVEGSALGFLSREAREQLAAAMALIAESVASRPTHVSQRNVERVCGLPARDFLAAARAGAFASSKLRRLVLAATADVVAYVDAHRRAFPSPVREEDERTEEERDLDAALAEVGGRRIAR